LFLLVFIPGENIILGEVLGEGEFGAVYEGLYDSPSGTQEPVAIKMLHDTHNITTREEFLREARLMMTFNHHCIVKLIGFSEGPPLLMVLRNIIGKWSQNNVCIVLC
jgi:tyrosine-protein kinase